VYTPKPHFGIPDEEPLAAGSRGRCQKLSAARSELQTERARARDPLTRLRASRQATHEIRPAKLTLLSMRRYEIRIFPQPLGGVARIEVLPFRSG
jgi:hypothetical protein